MTNDERLLVLEAFSNLPSTAENELQPNGELTDFLVMKQYRLLRDPSRFLIVGGRGSGKTKVFRTFATPDGFQKIIGDQFQLQAPRPDNCTVIIGYDVSRTFPSQDVLDRYTMDKQTRAYWVGSLLIVLLCNSYTGPLLRKIMHQRIPQEDMAQLSQEDCLKKPSLWISFVQNNSELWENILDKFDEDLEKKDHWVFVAYDALDRVTSQYTQLFPFIRSLLSFWFTQSKRWHRLRCKIFLRNDLYQSKMLNFIDASKLSNNVLRLEWTTPALYQLLIKRIANSDIPAALEYLQTIPHLLHDERDPMLGYMPADSLPPIEKFVAALIGEYMGNSPKKGRSYYWVPNHLQDANGTLAPRSFLKCFSAAADKMLERRDELERMSNDHLILPSTIQDALVDVSDDRVRELQEEYTWLEQLKTSFQDLTMLMEKEAFVEKINMDLWNDNEKKNLPAHSPQGLFSVLQELGIVLVASDGRVNVPEIYLHGFRMKRKGGLRRTKNL